MEDRGSYGIRISNSDDDISLREQDRTNGENERHTFDGVEYDSENVTWRDVKYQIYAATLGSLFFANGGMTLAFSNLVFDEFDVSTGSWFGIVSVPMAHSVGAQIIHSVRFICTTLRGYSFLSSSAASIIGLSTPLGSLISGPLMDKFGRKGANLIIGVACIPAWFTTSYVSVDNLYAVYVARFLVGLASGLSTTCIVYVSEICHEKYRATLLSLIPLHFASGILIVSVLQVFLGWRAVACTLAIFFCVVFAVVTFFTPETPLWLVRFRADMEGAKRSLRHLNPNDQIFRNKWTELRASTTEAAPQSAGQKAVNWCTRAVYRPLGTLLALFTLVQITLIFAFIMYAVKVFPYVSARLGERAKTRAFVLVGVARFTGNATCSALSMRVGPKRWLMASAVGMSATSLLLAALLSAQTAVVGPDDGADALAPAAAAYEWCKIALVPAHVFFATVGMLSAPITLTVELLPPEARSAGSAVAICYSYLWMFAVAKTFPYVTTALSAGQLFAYTSAVCALTFAFVRVYVPETAGQSSADIEKYFAGRR